jgi:hypothetical protein
MRVRPALDPERAGVRSIIIFRLGWSLRTSEKARPLTIDPWTRGRGRVRMFDDFGTRYRRLHLVPRDPVAQGGRHLRNRCQFQWDTPARKGLAKILFLIFDGGTGSPGRAGSSHTSISSLRAPPHDIRRSLPSAPRVIRPRRRRRYGWHSTGLGCPVTEAEVCAR